MESYRYPEDSDSLSGKVKFTAKNHENAFIGSVQLYMPTNVTIGDSATYGTMDLGAIAGKAQQIYEEAKQDESLIGAAKSALSSVVSVASNNKMTLAQYALLEKKPDSMLAKLLTYNTRKVQNPHTTSTFDKINIRSFKFSFKLIAESETEAEAIKNIDVFFRTYMYPTVKDDGLFLEFPAIWQIKFIHKKGNDINKADLENKFLPKIHDCFLNAYSSSYNSEYNSFHEDGAPFSVSFDLDFTETKPYGKDDILDYSK